MKILFQKGHRNICNRFFEFRKIVDDYIIFNKVKDNFTVGDQRIKFYKIECGEATVIS